MRMPPAGNQPKRNGAGGQRDSKGDVLAAMRYVMERADRQLRVKDLLALVMERPGFFGRDAESVRKSISGNLQRRQDLFARSGDRYRIRVRSDSRHGPDKSRRKHTFR